MPRPHQEHKRTHDFELGDALVDLVELLAQILELELT